MNGNTVKLVVPTDFEILEAMSDGKRQTATNLAAIVDRNSRYMNNRLAELAGDGLVTKVGPADNSHMYVITDKGRLALEHRDKYSHDDADEFGQLLADLQESDSDEESETDA